MIFRIFIFSILSTSVFGQTLQGHIHNRRTNEPVPFCAVIIKELKYTTVSDVDGNFKFDSIPLGKHKITATYVGLGDTTIEIDITKKIVYNLKIELPKPCKYDKSISDNTCPVCHKNDKAIPIKYGLLITEKDHDSDVYNTYYPGGCMISECDPYWYCKRDSLKY